MVYVKLGRCDSQRREERARQAGLHECGSTTAGWTRRYTAYIRVRVLGSSLKPEMLNSVYHTYSFTTRKGASESLGSEDKEVGFLSEWIDLGKGRL